MADFSYIPSLTGSSEVYHKEVFFKGHGFSCDLYFGSKNKDVLGYQIDTYNQFEKSYKNHIKGIERFIENNLYSFETGISGRIRSSTLFFDVIEIPFNNSNYDLVLVCGKTFKSFLIFKKSVSVRVEFKNGRILTIERKNNTIKTNW